MIGARLFLTSALGFGVLAAMAPQLAFAQSQPAVPATGAPPSEMQTPSVAGAKPGLVTPPTPADAATSAAPTNGAQVAEVIVTANRQAQALSHVGISVTALDAGLLRRENVQTPQDLVGLVPSFQVTTTFGGGQYYTLRGIGFNSRNASATSPIGAYLDETAVPYTYMAQGLVFDLDRVEVLKGPQGTLYGRATTGGLINYVTAKPTADFHYGGTLDIGNYSTVDGTAYVSGPINNFVRGRLAIDSQNRFDGYQESVTRDESLGVLHQHALRAMVDIGDGGPFSMLVTGSYWNKRADTPAPQATFYVFGSSFVANPLAAASVFKPTNNTQVDFLSVDRQPQADIGIYHPAPITNSDFGSLTVNTAYKLTPNLKVVSLTSLDELHHRDVTDAAGLQTESIYQDTYGHIRSFSEELRLLGEYGKLNWSVGGYYADDRSDETDIGYNDENGQIALLRFLAINVFEHPGYTAAQLSRSFGNYRVQVEQQVNVLAGFFNADYKVNDLIKLSGGARYTEDHASFRGCTYDYGGGNVAIVNTVYPVLLGHALDAPLTPNHCYTLNNAQTGFVDIIRQKQNQDNLSWHANIDITPNPTTLIYGSISRGFKAGGFPILAGSVVNQFSPVEQEELTSYEIGTKLGLFDRRVQLNAATFYYDYTNKQIFGRVADVVFGTLSRIRNVPSSREFGIEFDATWRITPELTATAAGAYLNSHLGDFQDFTNLGVPANFDGKPFQLTPKYQGNVGLVYDAPLNDRFRLNASTIATYQDISHADFSGDPAFKLNSRILVDATLGIAPSSAPWTATLYVKNIFDTYTITAADFAIDTFFRYAGMPRQFGVRVSYKY